LASANRPSGATSARPAGASVADHEHRGRPDLAEGAQQVVVADVVHVQVGEVQRCERADQVPVLGADVLDGALADPAERHRGRDADAGAIGPDLLGDRLGHLDDEPGAVLDRAAVGVGAVVGVRRQELVQQVPVGGVDLHPVGTGRDGSGGGAAEILHRLADLGSGQCARHRCGLRAGGGDHVLACGDGRRRHGQAVVRGVVRVADPADVHELDEQVAAAGVHGVGDGAPSRDVLGGVDAGGAEVALAVVGRLGALGDHQPERGALAVVLGGERTGGAVGERAVAGHGCQREAVRQVDAAEGERLPGRGGQGHGTGPSSRRR
jgi:hypothetical protein